MSGKVTKVRVMREHDPDPDTSYLGVYDSKPGPADRTIDREERGDMNRGEYRYFVAANSGKETGNPESVEQDYQRMEALNRGSWCYLGVYATAEVVVKGTVQTVRSPGLWGIESDSEESYLEEVGREELATLRSVLKEMGVKADAALFESVETVPE